ncbi:hypothetical protein GCM10011391_02560 [Pullulanibacillus camelliae]|uniref:Uncharacterized protein n=1 Tax=Pullulanibacillus camelliae TaxID=1707096 RepID=A0A8J2YE52_9BACL|nr:hypothetical protein GCM10011391_02560 [Pullulanibacillus camelliae]
MTYRFISQPQYPECNKKFGKEDLLQLCSCGMLIAARRVQESDWMKENEE